jgi:hypothetical protein
MKTEIKLSYDADEKCEARENTAMILFGSELLCCLNEFESKLREMYKHGSDDGRELSEEEVLFADRIREIYYGLLTDVFNKIGCE